MPHASDHGFSIEGQLPVAEERKLLDILSADPEGGSTWVVYAVEKTVKHSHNQFFWGCFTDKEKAARYIESNLKVSGQSWTRKGDKYIVDANYRIVILETPIN